MGTVTGSYSYNVICPMCQRKFKNTDMKRRWDGLIVCEEDWEPRHPMDFYRTINDNHVLPFVLTNTNQVEKTWTPVYVNRTDVAGTGTITDSAAYTLNGTDVDFTVQIAITGNATTATASATLSLPITAVSSGTIRVFDYNGKFLGTGTISPSGTTCTLPDWPTTNLTINIAGTYGV